jgi:hypothetical protein
MRIAFCAVLSLAMWGCGPSLVDPGGTDTDFIGDAGIELLDASDNRDLPSACSTVADCEDYDPCTSQECNDGVCVFSPKQIGLNPVRIATAGKALDVALSNGMVYVAEGDAGIEIYNVEDPANPTLVDSVATTGSAIAVDADERLIITAQGDHGMEIFSANDLSQLRHDMPTHGLLWRIDEVVEIEIGPRYVLAMTYADGVAVLNLDNMDEPERVRTVDTPGRAVSAVANNSSWALVADSLGGVATIVYDSENDRPEFWANVTTDGRVVDLAMAGDTALVAEYGVGYSVFDMYDPSMPERLSLLRTDSPSVGATLFGPQTGLVAFESGLLALYNLIDPIHPERLAIWFAPATPLKIDSRDGLVAVALGEEGVALLITGCGE